MPYFCPLLGACLQSLSSEDWGRRIGNSLTQPDYTVSLGHITRMFLNERKKTNGWNLVTYKFSALLAITIDNIYILRYALSEVILWFKTLKTKCTNIRTIENLWDFSQVATEDQLGILNNHAAILTCFQHLLWLFQEQSPIASIF